MNKLCMAVAVWGDRYVRVMLDYMIPSLLAPNNIPALANKENCELLIWTSDENKETIETSPQFQAIGQHITVKLQAYPKFFFMLGEKKEKYHLLSILHRGIIEYAKEKDAGIFFLPSDVVWADGSIKNIQNIIEQSATRVIVMATLRSDGDSILTALPDYTSTAEMDGQPSAPIINIGCRDLVRLSIEHQHVETASRFLTSQNFTIDPAHIYWDLDGDGMLARAVHLHPIYVHPRHYVTDFHSTFDADFLQKAVPNIEDYYVCDDSDLMYFTDLTDPNERDAVPKRLNYASELQIVDWYSTHVDENHLHFLTKPIWIHTGIDKEKFNSLVTQSDIFVQKLLMYYRSLQQSSEPSPS